MMITHSAQNDDYKTNNKNNRGGWTTIFATFDELQKDLLDSRPDEHVGMCERYRNFVYRNMYDAEIEPPQGGVSSSREK